MKRAADVIVAAVLLMLLLPAILLIALVIAVELRANPFFVHHRVGRDGELFRFIKLRTLPPSAAPYADRYAIDLERLGRFGAFIRRRHLDELPQLLLVVTGRMSLVGPRPEMAPLHGNLDPEFASLRTSVRPGCTGLWQISRGCMGLIGESPEFDRYYVRNASLRLDAWIMGKTVLSILRRGRLVDLSDVPAWTLPRQRSVVPDAVETVDA